MNEKDLVLGREYLLGEAKKYKGIYKGNFGKANYFQIQFPPTDTFTRDANGYVEFPLRGVFEIEKWKFTTPIAMKCTKEQFNGIKDRLVEMGYKLIAITFCSGSGYLSTCIGGANNVMTDLVEHRARDMNRLVFDTFNPDLFLALAAMTDKEDGIKGEWLKNKFNGKIYCQKTETNVDSNRMFRKVTAQEIIEHFEKKKNTGSLEFTVKVDIDVDKVAKGIFRKLNDINWCEEEEFVLQPRWYVQLTHENFSVVKKWHEGVDKGGGRLYTVGAYYGIFDNGGGDCWTRKEDAERYQIITFEQFKKYVLKESETTTIPIPSGKQAELFEDRVEIKDWKPKEGELVWVVNRNKNSFEYRKYSFDASIPFGDGEKLSPFIFRTESEAKLLVEKLKSAML